MNPFLEEQVREAMIKSIQENFLGKMCTVLTDSCAVPLKDPTEHANYYSGIMVGVDPSGVWLKHPKFSTVAFFSFPLQGIVEEQKIDSSDPRYAKIKEEVEKKKSPPKPAPVGNQVISVDEISARIRASKNV